MKNQTKQNDSSNGNILDKNNKSSKEPTKFGSSMKKTGNWLLEAARKLSENRYISSIFEGFMLVIPIIIVSSIFMMMAEIAPAFGLKYTEVINGETVVTNQAFFQYYRFCMRAYSFSYGLFGFFVSAAIGSKLMEKLNSDLPASKKVNTVTIALSSMVAYLLIAVGQNYASETDTGFGNIAMAVLGAKGILPAILVGFIVPNIYKLCYKYNVTIRLPKQVPQAIGQSFLNIFPLLFIITIFSLFGWLFAFLTGSNFIDAFFEWMTPFFRESKGLGFMLGYVFLISFTWFIGIHPTVWAGVGETLKATALAENVADLQNGLRPTNMWADSLWSGYIQNGGTGATIALPLVIILFAKSKQLKSIGFASLIPVFFQVNEPVLFGVPTILNPIMAVPYLITPLLNTFVAWIFVHWFGMPASTVALPWSMPLFLSVPMSMNMDWRGWIYPWLTFGMSFLMYLPFTIIQDSIYYKKEILVNESLENPEFIDYRNGVQFIGDKWFRKEKHAEIIKKVREQSEREAAIAKENNELQKILVESNKNVDSKNVKNKKQKETGEVTNILVVCLGAGTSAMLANSINTGAEKLGIKDKYNATATAVVDYQDLIKEMDMIIISPQARNIKKEVEKQVSVPIYQTTGAEYIELTSNPDKAIKIVLENLNKVS